MPPPKQPQPPPRVPLGIVKARTQAATFGAPLLLYAVVSLMWTFMLQVPTAPTMTVALGLALALVASAPGARVRQGGDSRTDLVPCGLCLLAVLCGVATGLYAHEAYVLPHYAVSLGQEYHNVLASLPGDAVADAGRVHFAETSSVDVTRALGYVDMRTFCVAPIVDSGTAQGRTVSFWAVGTDCCSARGSFACGGGNSSTARIATRLAADGVLLQPHADFLRAVQQAAATYDLRVDPEPILLHWASDAEAKPAIAVLSSLGIVLGGGVAYVAMALATLTVTWLGGDAVY